MSTLKKQIKTYAKQHKCSIAQAKRVYMKSHYDAAELFLDIKQDADLQIVSVKNIPSRQIGLCYQNAVAEAQETDANIVAGWLVSDCEHSAQAHIGSIVGMGIKHYWNEKNGVYYDTTDVRDFNGYSVYALKKGVTTNWITPDTHTIEYITADNVIIPYKLNTDV